MQRSVSFVERLELEFSGNHFSHALALGDVDGDGLNELVIGSVDGQLAVFKGCHSPRPWWKSAGLGTITCVAVGDILNTGANALVCVNTDGECSIFTRMKQEESRAEGGDAAFSLSPTRSSMLSSKPSFSQTLQPNMKTILIADIKKSSVNELFVGHMDRMVSVYCWSREKGSLVLRKQWTLGGQIGSLSLGVCLEDSQEVLVSQPGGTYVPIRYQTSVDLDEEQITIGFSESGKVPDLQISPVVGKPQKRHPTSSTEVVGHVMSKDGIHGEASTNDSVVALCTLDGCIRLMKGDKKQWELQVDHSLFTIYKLDVSNNGEDEIVVCGWDGMTYIVDQQQNIVRYLFEEAVCAFCAGKYGMSDGVEKPCLVYTTFSNRIYLYHSVILPSIASSNLLTKMEEKELSNNLSSELMELNAKEKQELFHKYLYFYQ